MKKILIALGALVFSTSVFASDFRFSYEASELSTPEKSAAFHERLEGEARSYCVAQYLENGSSADAQLHAHHAHFEKACLTDLVSDVVEKIGDQRLVAYDVQQGGHQG
jgi:UrcA family protein